MAVAMIFCYFIEFYFTKEFRSYEFHRYIHQIYQISCCMYNLCCNLYYVQKKSLRDDLYEMASSKELHGRCFPVNFVKFYRAVILRNVGERLFLVFTRKDLFKVSHSNTRVLLKKCSRLTIRKLKLGDFWFLYGYL